MASISDELRKLNELKEEGILSESEFQEQKKHLLAGSTKRDPEARSATASPSATPVTPTPGTENQGTNGLAIGGMCVGIFTILAMLGGLDDPFFGSDGWTGVILFAMLSGGLSMGAIQGPNKAGRGMAISGLVMAGLGFLVALGSL